MRFRRFLSPLTALAVIGGTMLAAGPSLANGAATCADATAMSSQGTTSGQGVIGSSRRSDWWKHTALPAPRVISARSDQTELELYVWDASCSVVLCFGGTSDSCTIRDRGEVRIEIRWVLGLALSGNYHVAVTVPPPTACSDGVDNDADWLVDYPNDPNCTSYEDATEAPVRRAVGGHITLVGKYFGTGNNSLRWELTGDFDPRLNTYTCTGTISPAQVTCTRRFDPEVQLHCTHFILMARAPGRDATRTSGFTAGRVTCDSGRPLQTRDVNGAGTEYADNTTNNNTTGAPVNLGTADRVVCRAPGVGGAQDPMGSFEVDCWEPGVQWPFADEPPLG